MLYPCDWGNPTAHPTLEAATLSDGCLNTPDTSLNGGERS
jgi:hypothetical protein